MPGPSLGFDLTPSGLGVGLHFDAGGTAVAPVVPSDARRALTLGFASTPSGLRLVYIKVLPVRRRRPSPLPSDARRAPTVGFDSTPSGLEVVLHFDAGGTAVAPVVPSDTCRALL